MRDARSGGGLLMSVVAAFVATCVFVRPWYDLGATAGSQVLERNHARPGDCCETCTPGLRSLSR
jgi:hypothetical protein